MKITYHQFIRGISRLINSGQKLPARQLISALLFVGGLVFASIKYGPVLLPIIQNTSLFRDYILSFGPLGILVFMTFQIAHIVIPMLPGELVQIAGGYIYGTFPASVYLLLGTIAGTVLVFFVSRWIGYPLVRIFVSKEKMAKFEFLIQSKKIEVSLLILFLLPGIPKDILIYICGLTPIKPGRFILISILARTPGLVGSAFIGANLLSKDYRMAALLIAGSVILLIAGLFYHKQIMASLDNI